MSDWRQHTCGECVFRCSSPCNAVVGSLNSACKEFKSRYTHTMNMDGTAKSIHLACPNFVAREEKELEG